MPPDTISFWIIFIVLYYILNYNFINSDQSYDMAREKLMGYKNTPRRSRKFLYNKCPSLCSCWSPPRSEGGANNFYEPDLEVTCITGGLNDKSLARLLPSIPKKATVIRIEAPPWNLNNFTLTQDLVKFVLLNRLVIKNCALPSLGKRTLESMKNLKNLELPGNKIKFLSPDTFVNLDGVEKLDLSQNQLHRADILPTGTFAHLTSLVSLNLADNFLENFDPNLFSGLKKLKTLIMSGNFLNKLPDFDFFRDLHNLEELHLAHCQLSQIPDGAFENNPKLKRLNLAENFLTIKTLKNLLKNYANLENLDLSGNKLWEIPDGFFAKLPNLHTLNLASNLAYNSTTFENFFRPEIFGYSSHVENLNLSNNKISEFNASFYLWPMSKSLKSLDLSHNPLFALDPSQTKFLTNLRHLRLSNVFLTSLPDYPPSDEYENLEFLDLSHNRLSLIPRNFLIGLKSLKSIDFSFNRLESFPHFFADFSRKLPEFVYLHNNRWRCDCETIGLMQDFLLGPKMRGKCRGMLYENITCENPVQVRAKPLVFVEKPVECSLAYYSSLPIAFYEQPGFTILVAGTCGAILLLGLIGTMLFSYFLPRASYRTNEEKAVLSTSTSSDSASNKCSHSSCSDATKNTDPLV